MKFFLLLVFLSYTKAYSGFADGISQLLSESNSILEGRGEADCPKTPSIFQQSPAMSMYHLANQPPNNTTVNESFTSQVSDRKVNFRNHISQDQSVFDEVNTNKIDDQVRLNKLSIDILNESVSYLQNQFLIHFASTVTQGDQAAHRSRIQTLETSSHDQENFRDICLQILKYQKSMIDNINNKQDELEKKQEGIGRKQDELSKELCTLQMLIQQSQSHFYENSDSMRNASEVTEIFPPNSSPSKLVAISPSTLKSDKATDNIIKSKSESEEVSDANLNDDSLSDNEITKIMRIAKKLDVGQFSQGLDHTERSCKKNQSYKEISESDIYCEETPQKTMQSHSQSDEIIEKKGIKRSETRRDIAGKRAKRVKV